MSLPKIAQLWNSRKKLCMGPILELKLLLANYKYKLDFKKVVELCNLFLAWIQVQACLSQIYPVQTEYSLMLFLSGIFINFAMDRLISLYIF
jgi:hypothetical protein